MQGKKKTKTQDQNHRVSLGEFQKKNTDVKRYKTKRKIYRSGCQQLSNSDSQSVPRSRSIWCFLTWVMTAWPANTIQGSHWGSEYINISTSSDLSVCCVYSSTNNCSALLKSVHLPCWVPPHLVDCLHNVTHRGTVTLPTRMGMVVRAFLWGVWTTNKSFTDWGLRSPTSRGNIQVARFMCKKVITAIAQNDRRAYVFRAWPPNQTVDLAGEKKYKIKYKTPTLFPIQRVLGRT